MNFHEYKDNPLFKQHILTMSRAEFVKEWEDVDSWIKKGYVVVSINDTKYEEMWVKAHRRGGLCDNLFTYIVADVEEDEDGAFTEEQALDIVNITDIFNKSSFIVHCFIGCSRSVAVAKWINEYLGLMDEELEQCEHYNKRVYEMLKEAEKKYWDKEGEKNNA